MTVDLATQQVPLERAETSGPSVQPSDDPGLDAVFSGSFWRRLLLLCLLVNGSMFFRGCAFQQTQFTAGFPAPVCEICVSEEPGANEIRELSLTAAGSNIAFAMTCGFLLSISAGLRRIALHRRTITAVAFTFLAFNVALVWPWLWMNTTFAFETWLLESTLGNERRIWVLDIFSRVYFVVLAVLASLVFYLGEIGWLRFVAKPGGKWWQFQLRGVFIVTTATCLIVAMAAIMMRK